MVFTIARLFFAHGLVKNLLYFKLGGTENDAGSQHYGHYGKRQVIFT